MRQNVIAGNQRIGFQTVAIAGASQAITKPLVRMESNIVRSVWMGVRIVLLQPCATHATRLAGRRTEIPVNAMPGTSLLGRLALFALKAVEDVKAFQHAPTVMILNFGSRIARTVVSVWQITGRTHTSIPHRSLAKNVCQAV